MPYTQQLNNIYKLYSNSKYKEAKLLNDKILINEPKNIYASRYQNLLEQKIKSQKEPNRKGPIPTVNGKSLKCPHCISKISISGLTQGQKDKIRNKDVDNLEIKCPYCHTEFMLQNRKSRSILGIKIGEKISYKQKNYRTVGYIEYIGKWYEGRYSGSVKYLEWILLGNDNSYLYFSEGYSTEDGGIVYEYEFSYKSMPKKPMGVDFQRHIFSNGKSMKEYCNMKVKSTYGENSKSFKIGEEIVLASIEEQGGKTYVYEQESSGSQTEVGIYQTQKISENLARQIFNKIKIDSGSNHFIHKLLIFLMGPIFMYLLLIPIFNWSFENKEKVHINTLETGKKIELILPAGYDKNKVTTSTSKYDYGGVKTHYKENIGFKFSIKSQEDIELITKIKENKNDGYQSLTPNEEKIQSLFEGNLIKLK